MFTCTGKLSVNADVCKKVNRADKARERRSFPGLKKILLVK